MWGKNEQKLLWGTAYLPLFLLMIYRFIESNNFFPSKVKNLIEKIGKENFDLINIILILFLSFILYKGVINWLFSGNDDKLKQKKIGKDFFIRKYEKLSVNDYSFFLMTLLLPLISLDYKSIINLIVSLLIILFIISVYVKTDSISVCPLFFVSGRQVFKAVMSEYTKEEENRDPSLRKEVIIITLEKNLDLNGNFRAQRLVNNVFYVAVKE
ncbi:hypothetical protein QUF94_24960 [Peribacillus sp. NJ4]|uniref:hypothetical protein n=1 Tax=Peribacillus sp. NJ4 TaxID=3055862 RepID=UPI0025A1769A|nr:hypothetical protein [Peribacillus sp. NJ4]MDM5214637.1 hypothetical protein [Peribacillus sp. NJ4]